MFLKVEVKNITNTQNQILQKIENLENHIDGKAFTHAKEFMDINNDMTDYSLPIDNETDLTAFEDKVLGDQTFKINLVCILIIILFYDYYFYYL